jgi:putative transposase
MGIFACKGEPPDMSRADRYLLPEQIYHVTHRGHDRAFLLKFARDRDT